MYLDATYLPLQRDNVAKEAVHLAIGIQANGNKKVLGYQIAPTESSAVWTELLLGLKQRGLQQVILFVADGLVSLESSLSRSFPQAHLQQCLVHVSRNLEHHIRLKDHRAVLADFQQNPSSTH